MNPARGKAAAAGGADIVQLALHTVRAIGALIAADPRIRRIGRQILVTALTVRSKFEHPRPLIQRHFEVRRERDRNDIGAAHLTVAIVKRHSLFAGSWVPDNFDLVHSWLKADKRYQAY